MGDFFDPARKAVSGSNDYQSTKADERIAMKRRLDAQKYEQQPVVSTPLDQQREREAQAKFQAHIQENEARAKQEKNSPPVLDGYKLYKKK